MMAEVLDGIFSLGGTEHPQQVEDRNSRGYSFHIWHAKAKPTFQEGDDVFVSLKKDKDTGRGRILEGPITEEGHPYKGRYKVHYYDGSGSYHVRPSRITKIVSGRGDKKVIVVPETDDMRALARTQLDAADRVADIGCSFGVCTAILASRCQNKVIGLEISSELVEDARRRYPHIQFMQLDVLEERQRLKEACAGCSKVFLDLGGNRSVQSIVSLLPFLEQHTAPQLIVIKNRELAKYASKHMAECIGAVKHGHQMPTGMVPKVASWWSNLEEHCVAIDSKNGPRAVRQYHLEGHKGKAPVRFLKYPLHYKHRANGQGVYICRYFNYGFCNEGDACQFDHRHCHHCGEANHIAKNCLAGLPAVAENGQDAQ